MGRRVLVEMALRRAKPGTGSSLELLTQRTAEVEWPRIDLVLGGQHDDAILCAVVGAVATRRYMAERRTQDITVAILRVDASLAAERLRANGYQLLGGLSIGGTMWKAPSGQEVDLLEVEGHSWPQAIREAQHNRDLQGLPILPLPYLVLIKLRSGRALDLADVSRMLGQAEGPVLTEVRELVSRLAPEDLADLDGLADLGRLELKRPVAGREP